MIDALQLMHKMSIDYSDLALGLDEDGKVIKMHAAELCFVAE